MIDHEDSTGPVSRIPESRKDIVHPTYGVSIRQMEEALREVEDLCRMMESALEQLEPSPESAPPLNGNGIADATPIDPDRQ